MSAVNDLERAADAMPAVRLVRGDAVTLESVRWLWHGFLPLGMLTIIGGAPGCGKTTIALSLAATVTLGGDWPDGTQCNAPGDVIVWSGEDPQSVIAARLAAAGADMTRVHFIDGVTDGEPFDPSSDVALLATTMERLPAARLLILDPIVSAVAGDSHENAKVRRALQPVVDLGRQRGCAVLGITHFTKGTAGRDPIERITGSIAFAALARVVLVAAKARPEPGDEGEPRRVLMRAKSNIGPDDGGFAYALERVEVAPEIEGQRVRWLESITGSAREVLIEAEADPTGDSDGEQSAVGAASEFLRKLLTDVTPTKTVQAEAKAAGISWASVRRAADALGVKRTKGPGAWYWSLPQGAHRSQHEQHGQLEHVEQVDRIPQSEGAQDAQDARSVRVTTLHEQVDADDAEAF